MTTERTDGAMDGKTGWGMGRKKRREWSGVGMEWEGMGMRRLDLMDDLDLVQS